MSETTESLEDFLARAEEFLAARYPQRDPQAEKDAQRFVWGEGSDEVRVFQEPDPEAEADALPAIRRWRAELWEHGLGWIGGPTEYGGAGLPGRYQRAFEQLTRRYDVPGDSSLTVGLGMIAPTIQRHGSEEQKQRYLPAMYSGEQIACQLFSEPGAGSDLASVSTRAVKQDDGTRSAAEPDRRNGTWRLSGQKVWTSGAHLADVGEILCRTAEGPKHRNLTMFLVDMHAPGVEVRPLRQMTGGAAFNEVFLDDVVVSDADRLDSEGAGWGVGLTTLSYERNAMGSSAFGGAGILSTERLRQLVHHLGDPSDPTTRREFGELMTELRVARYLQAAMAARAKAGSPPGPEVALNKIGLSENMDRLGRFVSDVLGGRIAADTGEWGTYAWTSVVLGSPGYRLGGGTDEVLKNNIARRTLGLPRAQ